MITHIELKRAMADESIPYPKHIVADGLIHNYGLDGNPSNGPFWYCLVGSHEQMCAFGNASDNSKGLWFSHDKNMMSQDACDRLIAGIHRSYLTASKQVCNHLKEERNFAEKLFGDAKVAEDHPYLTQHQVKSFGLRVEGGYLLIPLRDANRQLQSVQRISTNGQKEILQTDFEPGCYFAIGKPTEILVICIDYVTAASIHMATNWSTATAFISNNIHAVAETMRKKFPKLRLLIAGDDEWKSDGTKGISQAYLAAERLGIPYVTPNSSNNRSTRICNFNDMSVLHGLEAVRTQLTHEMEVNHGE